jgi:Cyclin, N-terminal domain
MLLFAVGAVLYLPRFFADPAVRIAHGVLLAIGCLILAARVDEKARASAG